MMGRRQRLSGGDALVLAILDETGGFTTGHVAARHLGSDGNRRSKSALMRRHLIDLRNRGFADLLDDQKPDAWVRTKAGSAALDALIREEAEPTPSPAETA